MTQHDIDQHITILGWLHIAGGVLFLVIGAFVFFLLTGIGVAASDAEALPFLALIGTFVGALMTILALPGLLAGYGLLKRRSWGRILSIIVGLFNLMNFPLGTLLGIYTLFILMQSEAGPIFEAPKAL